MWKANGKTTTLQLFLDSVSPRNMRDSSSGDKLKIALFGNLSLEEAMDLSRDRLILELEYTIVRTHQNLLYMCVIHMAYIGFFSPLELKINDIRLLKLIH
jgi:hypothetical protein